MLKFVTHSLAAAAMSLMVLTPAQAASVKASDPQSVLSAMQNFGMVATMDKDGQGDPMIVSRVSSTKFHVVFYGCQDNKDCSSVQFSAGYNLSDRLPLGEANRWNRENRFAGAEIDDEGDPWLRYDVNLDYGGVDGENFEDTLDLWRLLVEEFEEFIDW